MKDATMAPAYACLYPGLCAVARRHGYALAIHGSVSRDFDLVAVPWIEGCSPAVELIAALKAHLDALSYRELLTVEGGLTPEQASQIADHVEGQRNADGASVKPHGRRAWSLHLGCGAYVDVSVTPMECDRQLLEALLEKRAVDGLNGRCWHAGKHYEAEEKVVELIGKSCSSIKSRNRS